MMYDVGKSSVGEVEKIVLITTVMLVSQIYVLCFLYLEEEDVLSLELRAW